jgi:hypothetical protein
MIDPNSVTVLELLNLIVGTYDLPRDLKLINVAYCLQRKEHAIIGNDKFGYWCERCQAGTPNERFIPKTLHLPDITKKTGVQY